MASGSRGRAAAARETLWEEGWGVNERETAGSGGHAPRMNGVLIGDVDGWATARP